MPPRLRRRRRVLLLLSGARLAACADVNAEYADAVRFQAFLRERQYPVCVRVCACARVCACVCVLVCVCLRVCMFSVLFGGLC